MSERDPGGLYPEDWPVGAIDQADDLVPDYEPGHEGTGWAVDTAPVEEPAVEVQTGLEEHEAIESDLGAETKRPDPYLSPSLAAAMLDISPKTLNRWADKGLVTHMTTLGGHRRYRESVIRGVWERMEEAGRKHKPTQ